MRRPLKLLLAEDNPDDVFLLRQALTKLGATDQLFVVVDGQEAVAYLRGDSQYADRKSYPFPDVLLLDLNMPRMNGFEVLKWIRQSAECPCLMVHVLSASCRPSDIQRAYQLRANSYLLKPTRMDELATLVAALRQWHVFTILPLETPGIGADRGPVAEGTVA